MFITRPKPQSASHPENTAETPSLLPARPAALKTQPAAWERVFTGQAQGVQFELRLQRDETGHLHGRYTVTPGQPGGWHVEGQIRKDNTFALKGTENGALFEGTFAENATNITASFRNKDFQVERLVLSRQLGQIKLNPAAGAPTPNKPAGVPDRHLNRKDIAADVINEVNALEFTPASRSKKDRHAVFANIVQACRRLGAAFPEVIAAQWAIESHWGASESGKHNLFGIKEFDASKPRTFRPTKERNPKTGKLEAALEPFADYQDYTDGLLARINFTVDNPRYRKAGYFEAKTLREAATALARAGYGTDGSYLKLLTDTMQGCGVAIDAPLAPQNTATPPATGEMNQTTPVSAQPSGTTSSKPATPATTPAGNTTTAAPAAVPAPASNTNGPTADALDKLMGLNSFKAHYTVAEINRARELIGKQPLPDVKGNLFEILQTKVNYHNQRNNTSIGLKSDRWSYKDKKGNIKWVIFTGKPIGDIMCNLTSLAMVLETLGIESPKNGMQLEDYLEAVRRDEHFAARTVASGWTAVANQLGAAKTMHLYNFKGGEKAWRDQILPHLRSGEGVMMSLGGHIIRLQGVGKKGITVDDPYGKLPSLLNFRSNAVTASYQGNLNGKKTEQGVGEDNVYPWADVSKFSFLWIAAFKRKGS